MDLGMREKNVFLPSQLNISEMIPFFSFPFFPENIYVLIFAVVVVDDDHRQFMFVDVRIQNANSGN